MTSQSQIVSTGRAAALLNYCLPNKYILLGVGKTLPWLVEGTPPLVQSNLINVPELAFFVQTTTTYGLIDDALGDIILEDGSTYSNTTTLNAAEIAATNAFNILIEASIPHNLLPNFVNSYRAFGIYTNCSFYTDVDLDTSIIPITSVKESTLDTLVYFPPVQKQLNLVHNVKLVRGFK